MALSDEEISHKLKISAKDRVIDIGGSLKQHPQIDIDTLADLLRPEDAPYWPSKLKAKHFVKVDLNGGALPFKDKEFDVCLCTHVLEDLYNPFPIISEMARIAKRGYIAAPSRGKDMEFSKINLTDWNTGPRRQPGNSHHLWFFENKNNKIYVVPKNYPLLYTSEFQIIKWAGEDEFQYFWKDTITFNLFDPIKFHDLINEYREFMKNNSKSIKKSPVLFYFDNPLSYLKEIVKSCLQLYTS
jgi:hypothetical protein